MRGASRSSSAAIAALKHWSVSACGVVAAAIIAAAPDTAAQALTPDLGVRDESLRRLFTPAAAPDAMYEAFRSREPIATLAARLAALDPSPAEQAWRVQRLEALEAFGLVAPYDRTTVARLYGGARPSVVRGSLRAGAAVIAYTLVSPYPAPALDRLDPGTLVLVFRVPSLRDR